MVNAQHFNVKEYDDGPFWMIEEERNVSNHDISTGKVAVVKKTKEELVTVLLLINVVEKGSKKYFVSILKSPVLDVERQKEKVK